jgi:hypothetical protein
MKVIRYPIPADIQRDIAANLQRGRELAQPPVQPIKLPLKTRWSLIVSFKPWATWSDVWRNVVYLITGVSRDRRRR